MAANEMKDHDVAANHNVRQALDRLRERVPSIRSRWAATRPFHYVIIDDFLPAATAEAIHGSYPRPDLVGWDSLTYTHQKKKFTMRTGFPAPIEEFFKMSAASEFRDTLTDITGIEDLLDDPELVGGGLHQIVRGGFLDLHVDYNFHPVTKLHRRLNLILYMNKNWREEYGGYLELWDRTEKKKQLEHIAPTFNRAVIFETNEISYHGHPSPLQAPQHLTRKSLALYYYTNTRDVVAPEHNTLYVQSTGVHGFVKTAISTLQAVAERVYKKGPRFVAREVADKLRRHLSGLPPPNR